MSTLKITARYSIGDGYNSIVGREVSRDISVETASTYDSEPVKLDHYMPAEGVLLDLLAELVTTINRGEVETELMTRAREAIEKWHRHDPARSQLHAEKLAREANEAAEHNEVVITGGEGE